MGVIGGVGCRGLVGSIDGDIDLCGKMDGYLCGKDSINRMVFFSGIIYLLFGQFDLF